MSDEIVLCFVDHTNLHESPLKTIRDFRNQATQYNTQYFLETKFKIIVLFVNLFIIYWVACVSVNWKPSGEVVLCDFAQKYLLERIHV